MNVNQGDPVPNSGNSFASNLTVTKSNPNMMINVMHPISNVFLIYGYPPELDDTVSINLNQFQDSNGVVLSGVIEIKYNGTLWIPSVLN